MYGKLSASGEVASSVSAPVPRSIEYACTENGFERDAAYRKRLSGLTAIGITMLAAFARAPACNSPESSSRYAPMSPSSAFDT